MPHSGARKPTFSIGELSSCHAALTTAECDSASEPAGDERASDSVGVGGTNLMPRLRPMVCVAAGSGAVVVESVRSSDSRGAAIGQAVIGRSPSFRAVRLLILRQDGAAGALFTRNLAKLRDKPRSDGCTSAIASL